MDHPVCPHCIHIPVDGTEGGTAADLECKMRVQLFPVPLRMVDGEIGRREGGRPAAQMLMGTDANAKEGRKGKEKWLMHVLGCACCIITQSFCRT